MNKSLDIQKHKFVTVKDIFNTEQIEGILLQFYWKMSTKTLPIAGKILSNTQ